MAPKPQIVCRVAPELLERLEDIAEEFSQSKTKVISAALLHFCELPRPAQREALVRFLLGPEAKRAKPTKPGGKRRKTSGRKRRG